MKRIYLLMIVMLAFAANSFAQRNANLSILHGVGTSASSKHLITNGEKFLYDAGGKGVYYFVWYIINAGPDSLKPGDSLYIKSAYGSNYVYEFPSSGTGKNSLRMNDTIGIVPSASGGAVTLTPNSSITSSQTNNSVNWCDTVWARKGSANTTITDPFTNNYICHTVSITWWVTGINTITGQNDGFVLYPNPASNRLNIKFDFGTGANTTVVLRDITGKVILQENKGTLSGMHEFGMDISNVTPGLYTAELYYNEQKIVSKVNIQ